MRDGKGFLKKALPNLPKSRLEAGGTKKKMPAATFGTWAGATLRTSGPTKKEGHDVSCPY